ncbi:MAG: hypothetical protein HFF49_01770 [Lawsonibacter sp.]|jgi:hypothetical protein|nr:hypothetical protein [Lawsonibacter sp.]
MADTCIFCGKEIKFWQTDQLTCGGVPQKVCSKCAERYMNLSQRQRAVLALETGRAEGRERMEAFLKETEEQQKRDEARRSCQEKTLTCCGQRMTKVDEVSLVSRMGFVQDYTDTLLMFRCDCCGQVKFFDASFLEYAPSEEETTLPPQAPEPEPERVTFKPGKKPPWER